MLVLLPIVVLDKPSEEPLFVLAEGFDKVPLMLELLAMTDMR